MTPHTIPQTVLFPDLFDKPLVATFNQEHASSDGGAVLLKAAERVYGLVKAFAQCLADKRAAEKIRHTFADLIGQRIFGIACGHPDGNDADHLADDPIHKLLLGRDPVSGAPLASQPTISRFENGATRTALYRMLLDGLQIDRTSCCRFWANQLRVLLTAAAYVLMQELRLRAAGTACARTQVTWLRDRLLKLGVQVVRSVRRLVLHLPRATPQREAWQRIALALGARAG